MEKTRLCMLTEHSPFMMSFVFFTAAGRAVVIDGGRPADMPWLFDEVGEREIAAWILTHPHVDHISGFIDTVRQGDRVGQIQQVLYHFPSLAFQQRCEPDEAPTLRDFLEIEPLIRSKTLIVQPGMRINVDELNIHFLYVGGEKHEHPKPNIAMNESSIVFRVTAPGLRSVLFLGDLSPEGGRDLLKHCSDDLPSDIVQMSHHGHAGVTEEVYRRIAPKACMWCAPEWLWEEEGIEFEPELWGTKRTRLWMDNLGVQEHYVTKDGTQYIPLAIDAERFHRICTE